MEARRTRILHRQKAKTVKYGEQEGGKIERWGNKEASGRQRRLTRDRGVEARPETTRGAAPQKAGERGSNVRPLKTKQPIFVPR